MKDDPVRTSMRILVVDDEPDVLSALVEALRAFGQGLEVEAASSGNDAKGMLERDRRFDVVVSDIQMPGMTGLELLGWMRASGHPAARILLTAFEPRSFPMEKLEEAGPLAVFTKPLKLAELLRVLQPVAN